MLKKLKFNVRFFFNFAGFGLVSISKLSRPDNGKKKKTMQNSEEDLFCVFVAPSWPF